MNKLKSALEAADRAKSGPIKVLAAEVRRLTPRPTAGVTINDDKRQVMVGGVEVVVAPKEYDLLARLVRARDNVLSRDTLLQDIWGSAELQTRTIDQHMARLRKKLGRGVIRTVSGSGYRYVGANGL